MAVLSREDYLARIQGRIGEDTSDEAMQFIEDMTDTFDNYANKISDKEDWKTKYEENDKTWREKYKARFFSSNVSTPEESLGEQKANVEYDGESKTFDDLFTEREG